MLRKSRRSFKSPGSDKTVIEIGKLPSFKGGAAAPKGMTGWLANNYYNFRFKERTTTTSLKIIIDIGIRRQRGFGSFATFLKAPLLTKEGWRGFRDGVVLSLKFQVNF
jgi:hypothetical protein